MTDTSIAQLLEYEAPQVTSFSEAELAGLPPDIPDSQGNGATQRLSDRRSSAAVQALKRHHRRLNLSQRTAPPSLSGPRANGETLPPGGKEKNGAPPAEPPPLYNPPPAAVVWRVKEKPVESAPAELPAAPAPAQVVEPAPEPKIPTALTAAVDPASQTERPVARPLAEASPRRGIRSRAMDYAEPFCRLGEAPAGLDALLGVAVLGILLVNTIALTPAASQVLALSPWNGGVRFADLCLPWWVLLLGAGMPFLADRDGRPRGAWFEDLRAVGHAALLFLLGCIIESSVARRPTFGLGALQNLGLVYLVVWHLSELSPGRRAVWASCLLAAYWAALRFVPFPGAAPGTLTEGLNLVRHLNETYLAPFHLDGLPSMMPMIALGLIGTLLGDALRREDVPPARRVGELVVAGLGLGVAGWLVSLDVPFNRQLWTASFVLYAAGWGSFLLGLFYLVIDVNGWRGWAAPVAVMGANAALAYAIPTLIKLHVLQFWRWTPGAGSSVTLQKALIQWCVGAMGGFAGGWVYTLLFLVAAWLLMVPIQRVRTALAGA